MDLRDHINKMSPPYKEVMMLCIDGCTDEEIANNLGRERDTVRQQRCRGTKKLKELVKLK